MPVLQSLLEHFTERAREASLLHNVLYSNHTASIPKCFHVVRQSRSHDDRRVGVYEILRRAEKRYHRAVGNSGILDILCISTDSTYEFTGKCIQNIKKLRENVSNNRAKLGHTRNLEIFSLEIQLNSFKRKLFHAFQININRI